VTVARIGLGPSASGAWARVDVTKSAAGDRASKAAAIEIRTR